jgi:hypothetical protein
VETRRCTQTTGRRGEAVVGGQRYLVAIFDVFTLAQLWAFRTDLCTEAQGNKLFPMLGVDVSIGAVGSLD